MLEAALVFNALGGRINQQLTAVLSEGDRFPALTELQYAQACRDCDLVGDLRRQLDVFEVFYHELAQSLGSQSLRLGIKLATVPARLCGVSRFHALVADGFRVPSDHPDMVGIARRFLDHERAFIGRIDDALDPVFIAV